MGRSTQELLRSVISSHASHFSTFALKEENFSNSFIIFSTRFIDTRSLTKNVVSSACTVTLTSTVLNLNPFIVLYSWIQMNNISRTSMKRCGDKRSPCLVPLSRLKYIQLNFHYSSHSSLHYRT